MQWLEKLNSLRGILVTLLVLAIAVIAWLKLPQLTSIALDFGDSGTVIDAPASPTAGTPSADPDSMRVTIAKVEACPVAFSLPCYLMVEVKNTSGEYPADLSLIIDPGLARIINYEVRPSFDSTVEVDSVGSVVRMNRRGLPAGTTVRFYAQTEGASVPTVWLYVGNDLRQVVRLADSTSGGLSVFASVFMVVFFIAFLVVAFVLLVALIQYLSNRLNIDWG